MMAENIHATCIVIGERGILIRGPSGAGKSSLARALIAHFEPSGFARLVADDRVLLESVHGRLIARPHPQIAGRMEQRGIGIVAAHHEPGCVIALVVDLGSDGDRMPDRAGALTMIAGISLARLPIPAGTAALPLIAGWLAGARAQH